MISRCRVCTQGVQRTTQRNGDEKGRGGPHERRLRKRGLKGFFFFTDDVHCLELARKLRRAARGNLGDCEPVFDGRQGATDPANLALLGRAGLKWLEAEQVYILYGAAAAAPKPEGHASLRLSEKKLLGELDISANGAVVDRDDNVPYPNLGRTWDGASIRAQFSGGLCGCSYSSCCKRRVAFLFAMERGLGGR